MVKIFQELIAEGYISIDSFLGFSKSDPNLPYKRISLGDFEGSQELIVHCFIMNEILPKGLYSLIKNGTTDLKTIFFIDLNFDEFLLLNLRHKKNKEKISLEQQLTTIDEYWIRNVITLLKQFEPFLYKTFKNDRPLFEQTMQFLMDFKSKLEEDSIECLKSFLVLKIELTTVVGNTLEFMKNLPCENLSLFSKVILSKLKPKTFSFLDSSSLLTNASRDFENDYPSKAKATQYLRKQMNSSDFVTEVVEVTTFLHIFIFLDYWEKT